MVVLAVYGQVVRFDFINYDDDKYVTDNPRVMSPFTWESVRWAFTTGHYHNWHPLTWLSHKLDYQLFGLNPAGHHAVNAILHLLNALLLFEALYRMSRLRRDDALWCSALVAILFAVHPLHVESVAWVSSRKDVLSGCFGLLALLAYAFYVERPSLLRYAAIVPPFAMALMSKSILVTLPCLFLLLDYWPLERFGSGTWRKAPGVLIEKIPLFLLSGVAGAAALLLKTPQTVETGARAAQAFISYVRYVEMTIWPAGLAIDYPYARGASPTWQSAAAAIAIAIVTVIALLLGRSRRYVIVGWLWYLVALLPAIGFIQIGDHGMADRYTYIPLIGLFLASAYGASDLMTAMRAPRQVVAAAAILPIAVFTVLAARQTSFWKDSLAVFQHATRVTTNSNVVHYNLGCAYLAQNRNAEAADEFYAAVQADSSSPESVTNLGVALSHMGRTDDAIRCFQGALNLKPDHVNAKLNLGITLLNAGRAAEALPWLRDSLELNPNNPDILCSLGLALREQGMYPEAIDRFQQALTLRSDYPEAAYGLALALEKAGRVSDAVQVLSQLLQIWPGHTGARKTLDRLRGLTPSQ